MTYLPQPLDTAHVTLSPDLESLIEKLAVNVHNVWADQRIKDGWKFGKARGTREPFGPGAFDIRIIQLALQPQG